MRLRVGPRTLPGSALGQILRQRALEIDARQASDRMVEGKPVGVQELALEAVPVRAPAIDGIAQHWETGRLEVDPDLMRPPGLQAHLAEGGPVPLLKYSDVGDGLAPGAFGHHRHAQTVAGVAGNRPVDAERRRRRAVHGNQVAPLDPPLAQHPLEPPVHLFGARHDHQPAGVPVEPVHDAWPGGIIAAGGRQAEQSMHQRAGRVATSRMDHEPRRLVDNDQVGIFVGDPERNARVGLQTTGLGGARTHPDARAGREHVALARRGAVDLDPAVGDQALRLGAAADRRELADDDVDALPGLVRTDDVRDRGRIDAQVRCRAGITACVAIGLSDCRPRRRARRPA